MALPHHHPHQHRYEQHCARAAGRATCRKGQSMCASAWWWYWKGTVVGLLPPLTRPPTCNAGQAWLRCAQARLRCDHVQPRWLLCCHVLKLIQYSCLRRGCCLHQGQGSLRLNSRSRQSSRRVCLEIRRHQGAACSRRLRRQLQCAAAAAGRHAVCVPKQRPQVYRASAAGSRCAGGREGLGAVLRRSAGVQR